MRSRERSDTASEPGQTGIMTVAMEPLHVSGVLIPEEEPRDLWIVDGRISFTPVPDARTVAENVWIMPGLADAHCHIGLDKNGATPVDVAEQQAIDEREVGVLLIRDAGSPSDTRWVDDRADLPRIIRAGRHIARPKRYIRNFAAEIEPEDLVAEIETQIAAGDGWIKLVGDWIDREVGDLKPLWPADVLKAAVARTHELGGRITVHHFGEEGVDELLDAGVDGIEHGTGLTPDTIARAVEQKVALVPTMINIDNFPGIAAGGEEKYPTWAKHLRDLHARSADTFRACAEAGMTMYAGTDAGGMVPHGLISDEIAKMAEIGGAEFALGAASWRSREWLGVDGLTEGASADLVCYASDPREDVRVIKSPARVVLRGQVLR